MPLYNPSRAPQSHLMLSHINMRQSVSSMQAATNSGAPNAGAWPAANRAIFIPVAIDRYETITQLWTWNGTVNGNIDIGLYDENFNLLVSTGSVAMSGANTVQAVNITDYSIGPGLYFTALACSSATASFVRSSVISVGYMRAHGLVEQASAIPLPSVATPVALSSQYAPVFGLSFRATT